MSLHWRKVGVVVNAALAGANLWDGLVGAAAGSWWAVSDAALTTLGAVASWWLLRNVLREVAKRAWLNGYREAWQTTEKLRRLRGR